MGQCADQSIRVNGGCSYSWCYLLFIASAIIIDDNMNKYLQGEPNYDKWPVIKVKNTQHECLAGCRAIGKHLHEQLHKIQTNKKVIVFECYQGVMDEVIIPALQSSLEGSYFF